MGRCYIPSGGPDAWQALLAKPDEHWKTGHSARTLAYSWEAHDRLPEEISSLIKTIPRYANEDPELLIAIPEWKVPLPGGNSASQSDVFALIGVGGDLMIAAVEGKVSELFGDKTIDEWFAKPSSGKRKRLKFLCDLLGIEFPPPGHIRYQLLHRAASAVIECRRFRGQSSAMIVHSFSPENESFEDYAAFAAALGGLAELGRMTEIDIRYGRALFLGWARGKGPYLNM